MNPGQNIKNYPWCATRKPKDFVLHKAFGRNILRIFIVQQTIYEQIFIVKKCILCMKNV